MSSFRLVLRLRFPLRLLLPLLGLLVLGLLVPLRRLRHIVHSSASHSSLGDTHASDPPCPPGDHAVPPVEGEEPRAAHHQEGVDGIPY